MMMCVYPFQTARLAYLTCVRSVFAENRGHVAVKIDEAL